MKRSDALLALAVLVVLSINAFGAYSGFPVMDDGELLTTAREAGADALITSNRDRPVNAWLIHQSWLHFGERRSLWIATATIFWIVLAWQTARLVRRLIPEDATLPGLCALIVVAPLLVQMQHTTLTYVYPAMLPTELSLAALLVTLRPERDRDIGIARMTCAALLVAIGTLVSEYTVAFAVPAVVFLLVLGRPRAALSLPIGAGIGTLIFRRFADLTARPEMMPGAQTVRTTASRLFLLPARWLSGLWYTFAGAYATAGAAIRLELTSMSSIVALVVGLACATAVFWAYRREPADQVPTRKRLLLALAAAVAASVATTVLTNRFPDAGDFNSRFRLPILPFAVLATAYTLERLMRARWRFVPGAFLAFLAGYTALTAAFQVRRVQANYDEIARRVLPMARAAQGITLVALVEPGYSIPWAKLQVHYTLQDEMRTWALSEGNATRVFGPRGDCHGTDWLLYPPTLRTIGRDGQMAHMLWAWRTWEGELRLEPYCLGTPPAGR